MADERFDLIFRGDIVLGQSLEAVKQRLQQLFKADAAKIDLLFSGRPVALKRQLDRATAEKYQQVLHKAGAQVALRPASEASAKAPPNQQATAQERRAQPRKSAGVEAGPARLSLAPVGGFLLKESERARLAPVTVDVSGLSVRPSEGNLLDGDELPRDEVVPVTVPEFQLADAGEILAPEGADSDLPLPSLEPEDWGLADAGSDLLSAEERGADPEPPAVTADFELAPPGSDMGQLKSEQPSVTPDTSALRLAD